VLPWSARGAGWREISPLYLSEDERVRIGGLHRAGTGVRAIAGWLGRSPSTVSRELRRNRDPGSGGYRPFTAHKLAARRRARPRAGKIARDQALRQFVQDCLHKRRSPEQISQALRTEFPGDPAREVVHETIYQAVYRPELGAACPASCPPGCRVPADGGAGRTAGQASAARTGSSR
jgi:IS30 family transposase